MKKIIAVLLSLNLLVLNVSPALAQVTLRVPNGIGKTFKVPPVKLPTTKLPAGFKTPAAHAVFSRRIEQAALSSMRLPLTQNYAALLGNHNTALPPARQILLHTNIQERGLLLRSDFVALALNGQASAKDIEQATNFYRENLQKFSAKMNISQTVADIASLGLLGNKQDGKLIYQTVRKVQGNRPQAVVTAAAARALLRLEAYPELEALSRSSTVQPKLWEGLADYVEKQKLQVYIFGCENGIRHAVDISADQKDLALLGPLNQVAVNPSVESTYLYMNAGRGPLIATRSTKTSVGPQTPAAETLPEGKELPQTSQAPATATLQVPAPITENFVVAPTQTAALAMADKAAANTKAWAQIKAALNKIAPKPFDPTKPATLTQRIALYLTAFSVSLEAGAPIMGSIKKALTLPVTDATLVMTASFAPYFFGSFIANWLKTKIGRKATLNTGLALAGGSFTLGTALGFDGSFTAWENPMAQYHWLLVALTTAGTGCVFIHNTIGPVMTEISQHASEFVRERRGTFIEFSRSLGMVASYAFPTIAKNMLSMDWSASFLLALPIVAISTLGLNLVKLPNTKPVMTPAKELKIAPSPVMNTPFKLRKAMQWKSSILNNSYVRLLREEPGVSNFIGALFLMNAVEISYQSGFQFMIPTIGEAANADPHLLGMIQYAIAFLVGRGLAPFFLKWFPKRGISVATLIAAGGGMASLAAMKDPYAFTAALFMAELGISTAFSLSFARTASNHATQDRVTSLIMATAISCAVGPYFLAQIAQGFINAGILSESGATIATLLALPSALALGAAYLLRGMENKTMPGIKTSAQSTVAKIKKFFKRK